MTRLGGVLRCALLWLACVCLSGCFLWSGGSLDEQKDPNFLTGLSRRRAMNFSGAAEAFEKALEANPRSASAHLELGLLCYENLGDFAGAIYHFEKYLKLNPRSNRSDSVQQYVTYCKQEMTKGLPMASLNQQVQRELEKMDKLMRENTELRQQVEQLKAQAAPRTSGPGPATPNERTATLPAQVQPASNRVPAEGATLAGVREASARPVSASRTHVVKSGETPFSIARSYGVSVASLLGANPGLDPKRLRPGQPLSLPAR
ncbi:MAG TPA: LysM peptidoglycan-binding domain-containing protein [Verrucomicrobiae bacterium]|nr:LysM peptidoglycan-binding domain-containing protein [Verrucomicrobiae bacterium]